GPRHAQKAAVAAADVEQSRACDRARQVADELIRPGPPPAARGDEEPAHRQRTVEAVAPATVVVAQVHGALDEQVGPIARHEEIALGTGMGVVGPVGSCDQRRLRAWVERGGAAVGTAPERPSARRGVEDAVAQVGEPRAAAPRTVADFAAGYVFEILRRPVARVLRTLRSGDIVHRGHHRHRMDDSPASLSGPPRSDAEPPLVSMLLIAYC